MKRFKYLIWSAALILPVLALAQLGCETCDKDKSKADQPAAKQTSDNGVLATETASEPRSAGSCSEKKASAAPACAASACPVSKASAGCCPAAKAAQPAPCQQPK